MSDDRYTACFVAHGPQEAGRFWVCSNSTYNEFMARIWAQGKANSLFHNAEWTLKGDDPIIRLVKSRGWIDYFMRNPDMPRNYVLDE
jgi:hypothetical protein